MIQREREKSKIYQKDRRKVEGSLRQKITKKIKV
jgi:hypothetical protein